MPLAPTAGTKIYIGGIVADQDTDFVEADFSSATWVEIGGTTDLGTVGDKSTLITSNRINITRTKKAKGTRDSGTMTIVCGLDYADDGQVAVLAAEKTKSNYGIKVAFDDAPVGGTPSLRYFIALMSGVEEGFAGANDEKKLTITLEVNSNIVKVDAASA
jgi:hypothetical protein